MPASSLATVRTVAALRRAVAQWRKRGDTVALVPTMGALHDGHMALVARARRLAKRTVVSLFVNPAQFGPHEDFAKYPRDEAADRARLRAAGVDLLFAPPVAEIYPPGFATAVTVSGLADGLDGIHRPGHFTGVATVVAKLLIEARADFACFGEKDYQQLQIVKRMAADLDIPTRIVGVPTVRERDGLALSSRNAYLSPDERSLAPTLHRVLLDTGERIQDGMGIEDAAARGTSRTHHGRVRRRRLSRRGRRRDAGAARAARPAGADPGRGPARPRAVDRQRGGQADFACARGW